MSAPSVTAGTIERIPEEETWSRQRVGATRAEWFRWRTIAKANDVPVNRWIRDALNRQADMDTAIRRQDDLHKRGSYRRRPLVDSTE